MRDKEVINACNEYGFAMILQAPGVSNINNPYIIVFVSWLNGYRIFLSNSKIN